MKINNIQNLQSQYKIKQNNITMSNMTNNINNRGDLLPAYYKDYSLNFRAKQTVTAKLDADKAKVLKNLTEILSTNNPKLTPDQMFIRHMHKMLNFAKVTRKKIDDLLFEFDLISKNTYMTPKQRYDKLGQIKNEIRRLEKFKMPKEEPPKKNNEIYDYPLINRFRAAINDDNFELKDIYLKYYKNLNSINTLKDLKEKYPYIKCPKTPVNIIAKKCVNTLNREFYYKLDDLVMGNAGNEDITTYIGDALIACIGDFTVNAELISNEKVRNLIYEFCDETLNVYESIKTTSNFTAIPEVRKQSKPNLTPLDLNLFHIDYDKFVLSVLRQQYLEGKRLNEISYSENGVDLIASELKDTEYKFEKISEKIKKIISDSEKLKILQRDYKNFTNEELLMRLSTFANSELGNIDEIFDIILDFNECRCTPEDMKYMIKFLKELDYISDNKLNKNDAIEYISNKDLRPHGTYKLDKAERLLKEEKLKKDQQSALLLKEKKETFNDIIQLLYENNMATVVEHCIKYAPKSADEFELKNVDKIINIINRNIEQKKSIQQLETEIIQWDFYNEEIKNGNKSDIFVAAEKYSESFNKDEKEYKIGQYLWNADFVLKYPENKEYFPNSAILDKVMEKFKNDRDIATQLLCKYENYKLLDEKERNSIAKILEIFDNKDVNDKFLLKIIIENDYILSDTVIKSKTAIKSPDRTFASSAKQQIINKYKFPGCISYYKAFEDALQYDARAQDSSGVKKTGRNNEKILYKIEAKLPACTDRLFSSENNYYFDIYSDVGLH